MESREEVLRSPFMGPTQTVSTLSTFKAVLPLFSSLSLGLGSGAFYQSPGMLAVLSNLFQLWWT